MRFLLVWLVRLIEFGLLAGTAVSSKAATNSRSVLTAEADTPFPLSLDSPVSTDMPTPLTAVAIAATRRPGNVYSFDALANTTTAGTDNETDSASSSTVDGASPSQSTPSHSVRNCQWQGGTLRHGMAKYFVGRVHRRGSIFGECVNGELVCYEDAGLADATTSQHRVIACAPDTMVQRQRDLDLEDECDVPGTRR